MNIPDKETSERDLLKFISAKFHENDLVRFLAARPHERGFTIVELLIVIIVIGILATLVLIAYSNVQSQASDSKRASNAQTIRDAMASFKSQDPFGYYPNILPTGAANSGAQGTIATAGTNLQTSLASITPNNTQVSTTVSSLLNPGTTVNGATGTPSTPSATNLDWIQAVYCPNASNPDRTTATGVVVNYYQLLKTGGTGTGGHIYSLTTGTGCP